MLFSFGRDVNISWKHGINALQPGEQDGRGRISIILWGLAPNVVEEDGSPPMLTDDSRGVGPYGAAPAPAYHPHVQQQQRGEGRRGEERGPEQGRAADERRQEHRGLPRAERGERDMRDEREQLGHRRYDGHRERDGEHDRRGERDASRGDARDGWGDTGPGDVRSRDWGWRGERWEDRDGQRGERWEDRDGQRARDREGDGDKGGARSREEGWRGSKSIGDRRVNRDRRHANAAGHGDGHDRDCKKVAHAQRPAAVVALAAAAVAATGALQAAQVARQGAAAAHGTAAGGGGGGGGGSTASARAPLFSLAIGSLRDASAAAAAAVSNMPSDAKRRSAVPGSRGSGDGGRRGSSGADEGCKGGEGDGRRGNSGGDEGHNGRDGDSRRGSSGGDEGGERRGGEAQGGLRDRGGVENAQAGREQSRGREVCRNHARPACNHGTSCRYLHG